MAVIACVNCNASLSRHMFNVDRFVECPSCKGTFRIDVFPALFRRLATGRAGERLQFESDASCYYHAAKRAVVPCDDCGRFLCSLCDIEHSGRHVCPSCFDRGKSSGQMTELVDQRTCYDSIALAVALLPMMFVWLTIVSAPIAIYLTVRYWNAPPSIVPRSKLRFVLAAGIATLQLLGWLAVFLT